MRNIILSRVIKYSTTNLSHQILIRPLSSTPTLQKIKIYTKTGDKGTTALFSFPGDPLPRRPKNDQIFKTLGTIDELNAHVGSCAAFCSATDENKNLLKDLDQMFHNIQCDLLEVGSCISFQLNMSTDLEGPEARKIGDYALFNEDKVLEIEEHIDYLDDFLPQLTNFILPGGGRSTSQSHICRAVCRRAERMVVDLKELEIERAERGELSANIQELEKVQKYLNRLSDFFFTVSRFIVVKKGQEEIPYTARKPRENKKVQS